ncbi:MAG: DNA repair protein RecO [Acidobacteriaceae bacterium]
MAEGRLVQHHGEAIVLRTWPFHEADLLVSLFTREHGKVKGVARHAMRSRRRFGGALEPGTHVRATWAERPRQELARLDAFEILWSPLTEAVDRTRLAGLQLVVEVLDEAMPEGAPEDAVFRLAVAVLAEMRAKTGIRDQGLGIRNQDANGGIWLPVTYFCLWMNRLMGWMAELGHCAVCGLDLRGQSVWWSPVADGVTCGDDRRAGSLAVSAASVAEGLGMFRTPLAVLAEQEWGAARCADLRAFAVGTLERHLERRLRSAAALGRDLRG